AARTFADKHGYVLDPRQELLGIGAANLATAMGHGYPVTGGLSQSAVNDKAGARTPLALVFASITLGLCLLILTGLLQNLQVAVNTHKVRAVRLFPYRDSRLTRFPVTAPYVAREPFGLLRSSDCSWSGAASWNIARHSACCVCLNIIAVDAPGAAPRGISWPHSWYFNFFGHRPTSRE